MIQIPSAIKNLLLKRRNKFDLGNSYAVETGTYCGETLILIEYNNNVFYFLSLPKMLIREINEKDFKRGLDKRFVSFIEKIPNFVFELCVKQYKKIIENKNDKFNNRLK